MAKHHDQLYSEMFNGIFDTPNGDIINYMSGAPHHKQVADSLIKKDFRRNARIGTAYNYCKRVLPL